MISYLSSTVNIFQKIKPQVFSHSGLSTGYRMRGIDRSSVYIMSSGFSTNEHDLSSYSVCTFTDEEPLIKQFILTSIKRKLLELLSYCHT